MIWLLLLQLALPRLSITPGVVRPLTKKQICEIKWGKDKRHVTTKMKKQVAMWYGVKWEDRSLYEFDHLIPRQLAGADDVSNLWPQLRAAPGNALKKDHLENKLQDMMCRGEISLKDAQNAIRDDWTEAYATYIGK